MNVKSRTPAARKRATPRRLPDQEIALLDRNTIAWQDEFGTWKGQRGSDTHVSLCAPPHLQANAVFDGLSGPYLWIGIKGPGVTHGLCYAIVGTQSLARLASDTLRYVPRKARNVRPSKFDGAVNPKRATRHLPRR